MNSNSSPPKSALAVRLTPDDWLDAAFLSVVDQGFDSVRVLTLAQQLGVTRGSFYWHFSDHADLLAALLARWYRREIESGQQLRSTLQGDPKAQLEALLDAALAHAGADLENMRFELALRGLGRRDAKVAEMLLQVDQARMGLFEDLFMQLTGEKDSARALATLFYLTIVGSNQALSRPLTSPHLKDYLKQTILSYLVDKNAGL